jgi:hypothetical protein
MVNPGMLENSIVKAWLDGVEPAWTLLNLDSYMDLQAAQSLDVGGAIRLATDFNASELNRSAIARNMLVLLGAAAKPPGLKLTATGNLSRSVVAEMIEAFDWPDFNKEEQFIRHKVINEYDFLPLNFLRHLAQFSKLINRRKGHLVASPLGRSMLKTENNNVLQAKLFHTAFWKMGLSDLGRGLHDEWPQNFIGIVLWSLSVAADAWESRERLTRLCTVPINDVLNSDRDSGPYAMDAKILRPLFWFGLLEHKAEEVEGETFLKRHLYRKSELFDRFLSFDVTLERLGNQRH